MADWFIRFGMHQSQGGEKNEKESLTSVSDKSSGYARVFVSITGGEKCAARVYARTQPTIPAHEFVSWLNEKSDFISDNSQ